MATPSNFRSHDSILMMVMMMNKIIRLPINRGGDGGGGTPKVRLVTRAPITVQIRLDITIPGFSVSIRDAGPSAVVLRMGLVLMQSFAPSAATPMHPEHSAGINKTGGATSTPIIRMRRSGRDFRTCWKDNGRIILYMSVFYA